MFTGNTAWMLLIRVPFNPFAFQLYFNNTESLKFLIVKPDDGRCRPKHVVSVLLYMNTYTINKLCY